MENKTVALKLQQNKVAVEKLIFLDNWLEDNCFYENFTEDQEWFVRDKIEDILKECGYTVKELKQNLINN